MLARGYCIGAAWTLARPPFAGVLLGLWAMACGGPAAHATPPEPSAADAQAAYEALFGPQAGVDRAAPGPSSHEDVPRADGVAEVHRSEGQDRPLGQRSAALAGWLPEAVCAVSKCAGPMVTCVLDGSCRSVAGCAARCARSAQGEDRQRCNIECVEDTPSARFDALSACLGDHGCFPAPPAFDCAAPRADQLAPVDLPALAGTWYVVRGLSRAYDCWDGQRMSFSPEKDGRWGYQYDYLVDGAERSIPCTVAAPGGAPPGAFAVDYLAHGLVGHDDWYFVGAPDPDHLLLYYCGRSATDAYRGAVVMSRVPDPTLPAGLEAELDATLAGSGLSVPTSLAGFCSPRPLP